LSSRQGHERDQRPEHAALHDQSGGGRAGVSPGEVRVPRQRDTHTHRARPPGPPTRSKRGAHRRGGARGLLRRGLVGASGTLARVSAWLCAPRTNGVTSRSWLVYLVIGARAVREVLGRVLRSVRRWSRATVGGVWGAAVAGTRVLGWCWARGVWPVAITTGRLAVRLGVGAWRRVEPPVRDAAGWLVHTAPGLVTRLLLRLAGWLPVALARVIRHAVVGLGWLLARWGRYCLAYPDYAGIVREARELDRPRRARVALVAWRRAATRRSIATLVVGLAGWLGLWWLKATHGTLTVAAVLIMLVAVLALVGRAVRPLAEPEPGSAAAQPGPDDPYPIADAHPHRGRGLRASRAGR
jgi:hypothetical protein